MTPRSEEQYLSLYLALQKSGMFWELFPGMCGVWVNDREAWMKALDKMLDKE